ncbi:hypothetical protein ABW20_dc0105161 [Dactylellina cionopaga]|nr:hypothetical protein ABW20_dc0105161 [Dactylellina cionopaga]
MLAYYCGLGMTLDQAKKALYRYAYIRFDPAVGHAHINGPEPRVIYSGVQGDECGNNILSAGADYNKLFATMAIPKRELQSTLACNPRSSTSTNNGTSTASPTSTEEQEKATSTAEASPTQGEEEEDPEPTPIPEEVEVSDPPPGEEIPVVPWVPGGLLVIADAIIIAGGLVALAVVLANGTTTTVTATITSAKAGQTVPLSALLPSSVQVHSSSTQAPKSTKELPTKSIPTTLAVTITTAAQIPGMTTTSAPTVVATNSCNGLKLSQPVATGTKVIYQYARRDHIMEGIKALCLAGLRKEKNTPNPRRRTWKQVFLDGSPESFELDIQWRRNHPTESECFFNFYQLIDNCDNDLKSNPYGLRGGSNRTSKDFVFRIQPLYKERQPPRTPWVGCYLRRKWWDFHGWSDGDEFVVWGYGWNDAYNVKRDRKGRREFERAIQKCSMKYFEWRLLNGPNGTTTPWEWRAQIWTENSDGSCVQDVLRKYSGMQDLTCSDKDLEEGVRYPEGSGRTEWFNIGARKP